jgi:hypothetical protein
MKSPETVEKKHTAPAGATDQAWSVALSGLGNRMDAVPVISSPANIRCASGTKICVDTNNAKSWHQE